MLIYLRIECILIRPGEAVQKSPRGSNFSLHVRPSLTQNTQMHILVLFICLPHPSLVIRVSNHRAELQ